jgi:hypothetical protein
MTLFRHPQVILASFGEERLSFAAVEQVVEQCWEEGEALRKEGRRQVRRERERERQRGAPLVRRRRAGGGAVLGGGRGAAQGGAAPRRFRRGRSILRMTPENPSVNS